MTGVDGNEDLGAEMRPYRPSDAPAWDLLVDRAHGGTVLHKRVFLDYHGSRFDDHSLVWSKPGAETLDAVFPLAAAPSEPGVVVSHPGSSFGGLVNRSTDSTQHEARLRQAAVALKERGFERLRLRLAPSIVLRQPDDGWAPLLLRFGRVIGADLWSVLRLGACAKADAHLRYRMRRGERRRLQPVAIETPQDWSRAHALIAARLREKYEVMPIHSCAELIDLHARLGRQSRGLMVRNEDGTDLAAFWCIDYGTGTLHIQYISTTSTGRDLDAGTFGLAVLCEAATGEGFRQLSFGRSTDGDGWSVNRTLQRSKSRFGAGLAAQLNVEIELDKLAEV